MGNENFGIANLLIALLVPFLSVYAGYLLSERQSNRREMRELLIKMQRDAQAFRTAFLNHFVRRTNPSGEFDSLASFNQIQNIIQELNADVLSLGLMVGNEQSRGLGTKIQDMISRANLFTSNDPYPTLEQCQDVLNRDIAEIGQAMKPIWDRLNSFLPKL